MTHIMAEIWADQLMPGSSPTLQKIRAEIKWIRASLEAELAPDWLIDMVAQKWWAERIEEWRKDLY